MLFFEKRRKHSRIHFKEIEIGCINIFLSVQGRKRVDILYITKYLMALFQSVWTEPPFRAKLLFGEPPSRGLLQAQPYGFLLFMQMIRRPCDILCPSRGSLGPRSVCLQFAFGHAWSSGSFAFPASFFSFSLLVARLKLAFSIWHVFGQLLPCL